MKRIFRVFSSITCIILLLVNCEKEQIVPDTHEESIQKVIKSHFVKGDSIRNTNKELDQFLQTRFPQEGKFTSENNSFNSYGFAIDTEKILQLSTDTYTNYIFTTHRGIPTIDNTENYVLTVFEDGSYMQLLINYPLFENAGTLTPDVVNATVTYINDAMLLTGIESSPCGNSTEEIIGWSDDTNCYYLNCTAGGNHSYGESCEGSASQQPTKICTGGWVVTGCITYGGGGGSPTGNFPPTGNGGNSTNPLDPTNQLDTEVPVIPFIPYWQRVVLCVNNGAVGTLDNTSELPLSNDDITWLQSKAGAVHAAAIFDFLAENNCNESNKDFVKQAVEALQNDADVDFKHRIIIDATLKLKPCHAKVIKATFESTVPVIQLVKAAFNEETKYTYNLNTATIFPTGLNATTSTFPSCTEDNCMVTTTFDNTYLNSATDLAIAKTAIHESVHAVLGYLYKIGTLQTLSTDPDFAELLIAFTTLQAATTLEDINNAGVNLNNLQHQFMTGLIDDMAFALKDYGVSKGYNLPFSYYKKMIWSSGSMRATPNFQIEFSHFEQLEIIAIAKAESTATAQTYLINQYDEVTIQASGTKPNANEPCN